MDCKLCVYVFWCATFYCFTGYFPMQYVYIVDYQQYSALKGTTNRLASI